MHFDLTDDQKAIRDATADALRGLLPTDRLVSMLDEPGLNPSMWRQLIDLGLPATLVPADQEGLGLDLVTLATIAEQLGYAAAPAPVIPNALASWAVSVAGSPAQRKKWLPGLIDGSTVAAIAVADDDARVEGGTAWSARLRLVEWGGVASLLLCNTSDGGLALIDLTQPGVVKTPVDSVDRTRPLADVALQEARVDHLQDGASIAVRLRDASLVLSAANAFGSATRAMGMSVTYANERKQFDQLIGSFQGLKHQIANVTAELLPCRPLYWYAAHAWDAIPNDASRAAAIAKAHVTDVAVRSARMAVELHGGIGYTWEYPLHVFLKRAMYDRTYLGLPMVHRERAAILAGW